MANKRLAAMTPEKQQEFIERNRIYQKNYRERHLEEIHEKARQKKQALRISNPEKLKTKSRLDSRKRRAKRTPEEYKAYLERNRIHQQNYRKRHPERLKARNAELRKNEHYRERLRIGARARYRRNPEFFRNKSRWTIIKQLHKQTKEQYLSLCEKQDGRCAICRRKSEDSIYGKSTKWLSVDHDHRCCPEKTTCGKCRRGLLCSGCNFFLGIAEDSIERLRAAISYLEKWQSISSQRLAS